MEVGNIINLVTTLCHHSFDYLLFLLLQTGLSTGIHTIMNSYIKLDAICEMFLGFYEFA